MKLDLDFLKQNLIRQHQNIRRNPRSFIQMLEQRQAFFKDKLFFLKNQPQKAIRTKQGFEAIRSLIHQLEQTNNLKELNYSSELQKAAQDHANQLSNLQQPSQINSNLQQRVQRYTDWEGHLLQNLQYGFIEPSELLYSLLIDDGLKNRPNRNNILNQEVGYYGLGIAPHKQYNVVAVFVYATNLKPKIQQEPINRKQRAYRQGIAQNKNMNRIDIMSRKKQQTISQGLQQHNPVCYDRCILF